MAEPEAALCADCGAPIAKHNWGRRLLSNAQPGLLCPTKNSPRPMAEPEAAGAVDVAALRRAHWSFASIARPGDANTYVCVLCNEPYPCATSRALDELTQSRARAERMTAAAQAVLDDFDRQVRSHPALDERDPLELYTEPMLRLRAALAGDAPGRGEDT